MTEWAYVLTALLVLPIVILFRFVGCTPFKAGPAASTPAVPSKPRYRDYIMGVANNPGTVKNSKVIPNVADVIGYWRLVDAAGSTIAKDEKGFQDGLYKEPGSLTLVPAAAGVDGSEGAPGALVTGQKGLIASDPATCRFFNGGYVIVPFKNGLYTDEFTIEAWLLRSSQTSGFRHAMFFAGGHYTPPFQSTAGLNLLSLAMTPDNRWQISFGPTGLPVFSSPPLVPLSARTHVALTRAKGPVSGQNTVTLYIDGKVAAIETTGFYARPEGSPLFIGVSSTTNAPGMNVSQPSDLRYPVLSTIQEVVLHRKALSQEEIENHVDLNT